MPDQPNPDQVKTNAPQEAQKPDASPVKAADKASIPAESAAPEAKPADQKTTPAPAAQDAAPTTETKSTDKTAPAAAQKTAPAPTVPRPVEKTEPAAAEVKTNGKAEATAPAEAAPAAAELPLNTNLAFVIDDEPANRDFLERLINQAEYETIGASSGKEAIEVANALPAAPAIIAVDSELPDIKGIQLVKQFRTQFPRSKIVMATMHDDLNTINEAFKYGCDVFLVKPHGFMELFKRLKTVKTDPTVLENLIFDSHGVRRAKR